MIKLINEDCRKVNILNLTDKQVIVVTDPPFNIGYHYRSYKDKLKEQEYYALVGGVMKNTPSVIINYPETLYRIANFTGQMPERVVSWVYNSNTGRQHRDIAFFGVTPNFNLVRQPYKNLSDKRIQKRISEGKTGAKMYDWVNVNQVKNVSKEKTAHPCQMPLEVMKKIIGVLPNKKNIAVIDPFMGSGTTGEACIYYDVDFIGIEIDEQYYSIAKERLKGKEHESY